MRHITTYITYPTHFIIIKVTAYVVRPWNLKSQNPVILQGHRPIATGPTPATDGIGCDREMTRAYRAADSSFGWAVERSRCLGALLAPTSSQRA